MDNGPVRPANLQEAVKMKAKSLHFSKSGNVQPIASEIGRVMQCVCDQIPRHTRARARRSFLSALK